MEDFSEHDKCVERLLLYPYFWPSEKIKRFLIEVHGTLEILHKSNPEALEKLNQWKVLEYKDELKRWNWSKSFSEEQTKVLTSYYTNKGICDPKKDFDLKFYQVTDLVKIFRHKYIHITQMPQDARECLFGEVPEDKYVYLRDIIYVSFWMARFPKLVVFLWLNFKQFTNSSTWEQFYPDAFNSDENTDPRDLAEFLEDLEDSINFSKFDGKLESRYSVNGKTLEFHQISQVPICKIFATGSTAAILHIYQNHIHFHWGSKGRRLTYAMGSEDLCSMTGCSVTIMDSVSVDHIYNSIQHCPNDKIIFFVSNLVQLPGMIEDSRKILELEFKEIPLLCSELDTRTATQVQNGYFLVGKIKKMVKARDLLSPKEVQETVMGHELNELLALKAVCLFPNFDLPEVEAFFQDRLVVPCNSSDWKMQKVYLTMETICKIVEVHQEPQQLMLLTDKCGEGKSAYVAKLAREVFAKFSQKMVLVFGMRQFLEVLPQKSLAGDVGIEHIINVVNQMISQTDIDRAVVNLWFSEVRNGRIRVELFLDGLDEVAEELNYLSFKVVDLIREKCPSVRIWITCRNYMRQKVQNHFDVQAYQLSPLSDVQSISIVWQYCTQILYAKVEKSNLLKYLQQNCFMFALLCVTWFCDNDSDLLHVPLHCKMLVDCCITILETYALSNHAMSDFYYFIYLENLLWQLHEKLVEKKLEYFLNKYELHQPTLSASLGHNKNLHMDNMKRSATLLALGCAYCNKIYKLFERQLSPDPVARKILLDQGFVKDFDELEFCHKSIRDAIIENFVFNVVARGKFLGVEKWSESFLTLFWENYWDNGIHKNNLQLFSEEYDIVASPSSEVIVEFGATADSNSMTIYEPMGKLEIIKSRECIARYNLEYIVDRFAELEIENDDWDYSSRLDIDSISVLVFTVFGKITMESGHMFDPFLFWKLFKVLLNLPVYADFWKNRKKIKEYIKSVNENQSNGIQCGVEHYLLNGKFLLRLYFTTPNYSGFKIYYTLSDTLAKPFSSLNRN